MEIPDLDNLTEEELPPLPQEDYDALSTEEAHEYASDPVAFYKRKYGEQEGDPVDPEKDTPPGTTSTEEDNPATEDGDDVQAKTQTEDVEDGEGEDTPPEPPTAEGGDSAENPFRDQGIPDDLMVDAEGQPYENGKILGEYDTPEDYHKGMAELRRKFEQRAPATESYEYPEPMIPAQLDREQSQMIAQHALENALAKHAGDFQAAGLDPNEFTDAKGFQTLAEQDAGLYRDVRRTLEDIYQKESDYTANYLAVHEMRPQINEEAADAGFSMFAGEFQEATGEAPDNEDLGYLREAYNETIGEVQAFDEWVQEQAAANPQANLFANPKVAQFYTDFYANHHGVLVLDPRKVSEAALAKNRDLLYTAISRTSGQKAAQKYEQAIRKDAADITDPPKTATSAAEDGVTGGRKAMMPLDELLRPDAIDRLVEEYGDVDKATEAHQRMIDHYDDEWRKTGGRPQKRVVAEQPSY